MARTGPGHWRGQHACARGGMVAASPVAEAERVQRREHLRRVADTPGKVGCPGAHRRGGRCEGGAPV
jgi:hypothetical protein